MDHVAFGEKAAGCTKYILLRDDESHGRRERYGDHGSIAVL